MEVRERLNDNNRLVQIGNTVVKSLANKLRLDWSRQLLSEGTEGTGEKLQLGFSTNTESLISLFERTKYQDFFSDAQLWTPFPTPLSLLSSTSLLWVLIYLWSGGQDAADLLQHQHGADQSTFHRH